MSILIADDQPAVRSALTLLFEERLELDVVGGAADSKELLAKVELLEPDIIVLDQDLPGPSTAELLTLVRRYDGGKVVVLGVNEGSRKDALAAGADAFVYKSHPPKRLLTAIRALSTEDRLEQ